MCSFSSHPAPAGGIARGGSAPCAGLVSEACFVLEGYDPRSNARWQERGEAIHKNENTGYKMSRQDWLHAEGTEMNI